MFSLIKWIHFVFVSWIDYSSEVLVINDTDSHIFESSIYSVYMKIWKQNEFMRAPWLSKQLKFQISIFYMRTPIMAIISYYLTYWKRLSSLSMSTLSKWKLTVSMQLYFRCIFSFLQAKNSLKFSLIATNYRSGKWKKSMANC